jgi:hypothetical protein
MPKKKLPPKKKPQRYQTHRLIVLLGLLYIASSGFGRLSLAWNSHSILSELGFNPGPFYLGASGLSWLLLGLTGAALVLVSRIWAYRSVFGLSVFIALSYWLDRLFLTSSGTAHSNWLFALFATLLLLAYSASLMILLSKQDLPHVNNQ